MAAHTVTVRPQARRALDFYTMSEDNEPNRLAELAGLSEAMRHEVEQAQRFFRENEPLIRQIQQIAQDVERIAGIGGWPVPPFQQRLVRAAGAAMRELLPPRPVAHQRTAGLIVNPSFAASARVTAGTGLVIQPIFGGDVATATETGAVKVVPDPPGGLAGISDRQILNLVVMWLLVLVMPVAIVKARLSQDGRDILMMYYAVIGEIAVAYTTHIISKRK